MRYRFAASAIARRRKFKRLSVFFITLVIVSVIAFFAFAVVFVSIRPADARAFSFPKLVYLVYIFILQVLYSAYGICGTGRG